MAKKQTKSLSVVDSKQSTELQKMETAATAARIKASTDDEIAAVIRYLIVLLGIPERNDPVVERDEKGEEVPIGKMVIMNYIKSYWQELTLEQIKLAFELAVNGKLFDRDNKPVDLSLYDRPLNAEYIGKVITCYRVYEKCLKDPAKKEAVKELPPPPLTNQRSYEIMCEHIEKFGNLGYSWAYVEIFQHLEESKLIEDTIEEKQMFAGIVKQLIQAEIQSNRNTLDFDIASATKEELNGDKFKKRCRKERVLTFMRAKYKL